MDSIFNLYYYMMSDFGAVFGVQSLFVNEKNEKKQEKIRKNEKLKVSKAFITIATPMSS